MPGQVWAVSTIGGYMYADNLSKELRMAVQPICKFRQFCDVKDAAHQGKKKGDTFHWDIYLDVSTQGTKLTETKTMPETQFTIIQGTLTIDEYGNSVPYSGKLDDLSEHPVRKIVNKVLKFDARKAMDIDTHAQFDACLLRAVPTGGTSTSAVTLTTNGTATLTNNVALGNRHIGALVDAMKERDIPPYTADDYYALSHPSTFRELKNDLEGVYQYTTEGYRKIIRGEIGRYESVRFIEQTYIPKGGAADSGTWSAHTKTADAWNNAKSSWAFFFGEDTVAEAVAVPIEMRGKIPSDYGRSKGVAWYALLGYGIVHTNAAQSRIVKWDSAS
jgi:N4-gp56 family major capsid protein